MKNAWRAQTIAMIVSVLAVTGCTTTQPGSVGTRTASVGFSANALVELWDCYEEWQDTTGPNGVPDGTPDVKINDSLVCFPALDNGVQIRTGRAVPWRFSVKITVIHAGSVNEDVVISSDGATVGSSVEPGDVLGDFVSLTDYDPDLTPAPNRPNVGDIYYLNGLRLSTGSPVYLANLGVDPGVPNLLDLNPPTFPFNLTTGDTVIVRARKQDTGQAPPGSPPYPELKLTAALNVSGVVVAPESTPPGNPPTTSVDNKAGMTFSFTVR